MAHLAGHDRSQLLLLPEAVDDYVGADNPVRFIEAFVGACQGNWAGLRQGLRLGLPDDQAQPVPVL